MIAVDNISQSLKDIPLSEGIKGSIQGSVTESDGMTPLQDILVSAYILDSHRWCKVADANTDNNGNYTIANLADGYYQIEFHDNSGKYSNQYYYQQSNCKLADHIHIEKGQPITNINGSLLLYSSITGKVTEADGKMPCDYVWVYCIGVNNSYNSSRATDKYGNYKFDNLKAGKYRIEFRDMLQGYAPSFYNNRVNEESSDIIEVIAGETVSSIDACLVMGGEIRGKVTLPDKKTPVKGADITVYLNNSEELDPYDSCKILAATTDKKGCYRIIGLAPGTYMLKCEMDRHEYNKNAKYEGYAAEYWVYDIDVSVNNIITKINFSLSFPGNIQGKVVGYDGITPLRGIKVRSSGKDHLIEPIGEPKTYTDIKGIYTLSGLACKSYKIGFFDDSGRYLKQTDKNIITVKPEQTYINDDIALSLAGHIQGRVTEADSAKPLKNIIVSVYRDNNYGDNRSDVLFDSFLKKRPEAKTDKNGNYDIGGLDSGSYWIEFKDESKTYLTQFYNNKFSLEDADTVQASAGNTVTGIDIALREYKRK